MKARSSPSAGGGWLRPSVARFLLIYGLLALGSVVFVWPLFWMAGTSFKSGREVINDPTSFTPRRPVPRAVSPYLDDREYPAPAHADREALAAIRARLAGLDYPWPSYAPRDEAIETAARGVLQRLRRVLPADAWKGPAAGWLARVDAPLVEQTLEGARRELCFGSLRLFSLDVREQELASDASAVRDLHVEGDPSTSLTANTNTGKDCALLRYDLGRADTVRLGGLYTTDFTTDRLYRVQLALHSDASWNTLTAYVERGGVLYRARTPTILDDSGHWSVATWQPPGRDDQTNKVRLWTTLQEIDRGPQYVSDPHQIRLTFELRRVGALAAWWEKLGRNYALALDYIPFWRYVATSLFLVLANVTATLFSCSFVAYSFARLKWPGRRFSFVLMLATMMLPSQITMIPQFLIVRQLGWYNTLLPLWVPSWFGSAFFIFLLVQFLRGVPRDLEDAARIDGCGFLRIYWHIMLPLVKPTLAAIAVLTFVGSWNDFMGPLIYVGDQGQYPLSLGLYAFTVQASADAGTNMSMTMAGALLMTLPVVAVFFFAQRYFIQGVALSGIK